MLQVVELNSDLFFEAYEALENDFDLTVTALASSLPYDNFSPMAFSFFEKRRNNLDYFEEMRTKIQEKVRAYDTFMKVVLVGMSLGNESCCLTLLNQGAETEVGYKKLIAEYLDVPYGK
jgi:hypothetical protein